MQVLFACNASADDCSLHEECFVIKYAGIDGFQNETKVVTLEMQFLLGTNKVGRKIFLGVLPAWLHGCCFS